MARIASARSFLFVALAAGTLAAVGCSKGSGSSPEASASAAPDPAPAPAAPAPEVDSRVTFKKKAPAVGSKRVATEQKTMKLAMTLEGAGPQPKSFDQGNAESIEKTEEVLEVVDSVVTKLEVTYTTRSDVATERGKETSKKSPLIGKTYVVEAKGGKILVTTKAGARPPAAEAKAVEGDYKSLGKDEFDVPERPLKIGEPVNEMASALKSKLLADDSAKMKPTIQDVEIKLASVREEGGVKLGVFDVSLKMGMSEGPVRMVIDLSGQLEVRVDDAQPASMKLAGPILVSLEKKPTDKMSLTGSGDMSMHLSAKYL